MATHSSVLAWRIQWTEEPGGLQSMGLERGVVILDAVCWVKLGRGNFSISPVLKARKEVYSKGAAVYSRFPFFSAVLSKTT